MHRIKTTLAFLLQLLFFGSAVGQQAGLVDFQKIEATVFPNAQTASVHGQVSVQFTILQDTPSVFLDAVNFTEVLNLGGTTLTNTGKRLVFTSTFKAGQPYTVSFSYTAKPKQTLYFTGGQIWTQGQGKYTSHWLPSLDSTNDKIEFDLTLKAPRGKTAIANGKLLHKKNEAGYTFWQYDMQRPMSSYLVALAIGDFKKKAQQSATGHPIELYIKPEDLKNHGPTYRYTKQLFDFFETEIGVPFPWQNYKQVPVRDFLYAGMENTTLTIFSEAFVVDSIAFPDRNYVNVNAHELAHQWFGNLVTATNGTHHWLHEG
ncbi:MAG: M1 family aminopeptidase, partial [Marinirhabdus sp.]